MLANNGASQYFKIIKSATRITNEMSMIFQFCFSPSTLQQFFFLKYKYVAPPKNSKARDVKSQVYFPIVNAVETLPRPKRTITAGPKQQRAPKTPAKPPAYNNDLSFFIFSFHATRHFIKVLIKALSYFFDSFAHCREHVHSISNVINSHFILYCISGSCYDVCS